MDFITLQDVTDEIVTCIQSDVDEANSYLTNISKRLNVKEERIVTPAAYTLKRLGVVYALYIACVRCMGKDNIVSLDTESLRSDIYAQKARYYREEIKTIEKSLSESDFTADYRNANGVVSVPVRRA